MTPVDVIRRLQATPSRIEKENIIFDAWMAGCTEFFRGAQLAYDILMPFHVAKVAAIDGDDDIAGHLGFADFERLADRLHRREVTGHAARDAIHAAAEQSDFATWNEFYRRILLKDLRAGVEAKTINKVLDKIAKSDRRASEYLVPVFACQLAQDANNHEAKVRGKKQLDMKLDGVRLLTFLDKETGTVTQRTRNGKINENFSHITVALRPLLDKLPISLVLDGEIVGPDFQTLMTQVNRKERVEAGDAKLALFDVVLLDAFRRGYCNVSQADRHTLLCGLIPHLQSLTAGSVYVLPKLNVDLDTAEGQKTFKEFIEQAAQLEFEGVMIKDPQAPYEAKRGTAWLKMKPFITVTLEIVGMKGGTGKLEGTMGAIFCYGIEDGRHILSRCGGGFNDKDRDDFIANDGYMHFLCEVRADKITTPSKRLPLYQRMQEVLKDEEGNKPPVEEMMALAAKLGLTEDIELHSLRFPRYKGLRGSEPGEKL